VRDKSKLQIRKNKLREKHLELEGKVSGELLDQKLFDLRYSSQALA
jgi:hypothetical protein